MNMKEIIQTWERAPIIVCIGLFLCFNCSRIIGDAMLSSGMPFPAAYSTVILLTNIVPLILIFMGFRNASPIAAFCILFGIRFIGTIFADLVIFQAPSELLGIPAYLIDLTIAGTLLGVYAAGVSFLDRKRDTGLLLIAVSLALFFLHLGTMIVPGFFGGIISP